MKQSKIPLWKKSMLQNLNLYDIITYLQEIAENGEMYGYERCYEKNESGYYQEYKELFDELAYGANNLLEVIYEWENFDLDEHWDDMAVTLLGYQQHVLGYDSVETDYYAMAGIYDEDFAIEEAEKRIMQLTKKEMVQTFRKVLVILTTFFDLKASHDCLTSIVDELDFKGAILAAKNDKINSLYEDLTGTPGDDFDEIIANLPQRMWIE